MNKKLDDYDAAVHAVYDAALQPGRWPAAVESVAHLFDAPRALLFTWAHAPSQGGFTFAHGLSQATLEWWAAKSMHEDPIIRVAGERGLLTEGSVVMGDELVSLPDLHATPFYRELWQPIGIAGVCGSVIFNASDAHRMPTGFSIYHGSERPRFPVSHRDLMQRVAAHISRSLGVMFHLRDRQLQVASTLGALNRLSAAVFLIDARRRLEFANVAGVEALQRGTTLTARSEDAGAAPGELKLHPRLHAFKAGFQKAVDDALLPWTDPEPAHFSHALVLPDHQGRPIGILHAGPLSNGAFGEKARAVVFFYDLATAGSLQPAVLCKLFGATAAEAGAGLQILQGGSAKAMAARLGVSVNTFNTQLKAIYAKTGTNRQADLMKLLLSLASH